MTLGQPSSTSVYTPPCLYEGIQFRRYGIVLIGKGLFILRESTSIYAIISIPHAVLRRLASFHCARSGCFYAISDVNNSVKMVLDNFTRVLINTYHILFFSLDTMEGAGTGIVRIDFVLPKNA